MNSLGASHTPHHQRVLTFGTFDHLHPGHMAYLRYAESMGSLFVVIARDETVQILKGHLPDQSEDERCNAVKQAFPNATIILGDTEDYFAPVAHVQPDLIVLGYDQKLPPNIQEKHFPCPVIRAEATNPQCWKSSLMKKGIRAEDQ